jgi:hypothetical protein
MDKDRRLYARFALDFPDSPKIAPLSDAAFRALVEMTCHSRRMLDDGFIDERIASRKWRKKVIEELCSNDTVRPSLFRVDGGFQLHDFSEHQQTRADIEKKREAGRAGGQARAQAHAKAPAEAPSKLTTETETESSSSTKKSVSASRRKPETSMPDDWMPKPAHVAYALERGVDGRHEEGQFRAWVSSKDARYRDWDAAFRSWLGRATPGKASPTARAQRTVMLATDLLEVEA